MMQSTRLQRPGLALLVLSLVGASTMVPAAEPGREGDTPHTAPMCGEYGQLRSFLNDQFGEKPASAGLADDGTIMQVFASLSAGTWTMVSIGTDGVACVLATGQAWQQDTLAGRGQPV